MGASFCRLPEEQVEARIDEILPQMTLKEKVEQMSGSGAIVGGSWRTPGNARLGIPPFGMLDGPRGVSVIAGNATAFPVAMARGATWDPDLERRVGEAIGAEVRAKGANVLLAPTINLLRHPSWGRAQETYGEDPHHLGRMGVGFIQGAQRHVIASVKHLAANSIEDTRFDVNVTMDERTLREVYLPHFRAAVQEAAVGSVMTAYNKLNGRYCAENFPLVREILKSEWGFRGFVESDWVLGTRSTVDSALAGLDIEMPGPSFYDEDLTDAVESGEAPIENIDDAVRRVLRVKFCFALDTDPPVPAPRVVERREHTDLALEAAREATVLLKNDGSALPLERGSVRSVAVVGALADRANLGDTGSSNVSPSFAITPLEGLRDRAGPVEVVHVSGGDVDSPGSRELLAAVDAVVIVAGLTAEDEGEGLIAAGDRRDLALSAEQESLIRSVAAVSARTIVVLEGGSAIIVERWIDQVEAVVLAWYPGQEGGGAIADVLFGDVNPSGKLPFTVPRALEDLPEFVSDPARLEVTYGFDHGYRWVDRRGIEPRFPFGFGLSYTSFEYLDLAITDPTMSRDGRIEATARVRNAGARAGDEIVQLYVSMPGSRVLRPVRELKAFARVHLEPGETTAVTLTVPARDLAYYDVDARSWIVEDGRYTVAVGTSSRILPLHATVEVRS